MASPSTTPTFPPFHPTEDGGAVGKRWKKWLSRLENYLVAIDIQDEARKKAMLLHFMGEETHTIYENLASATPPAQNAAAENEDENEDQAVAEPTYDDGCPARNQKCLFCSKLNHFAKVCRAKRERRVHRIKEEDVSNSDDEYTFTVGNNPGRNKLPYREVKVGTNKVNFLIDTGASINVIGEETHRKVGRPKLTPCRTVIRPYGGGKLPVKGKFQTVLESGSKITVADIYVIEGKKANSNLLSYPTAVDLMLVEFKHSVNAVKADKAQQLEHEYRDVFNNGIGKLKNTQIKLHVDETVSPVRQPHRRIPFHMRKQVENELKELEKQDIIERVDGPTPWVSPIVVVPKPKTNSIRICIDMREANKAIQRERHVTPTIDDLIHDLNGATHFSHLDLRSGYHQLELHPDSRNVTTFATHVGLRRYKRLIFGINAASEIFQNTIEQVLAGIKGVRNISDDIIVYGKGQEAHDRALHDTLKRLRETGLTLNHEKCEFNKTSLEFYGHVFGKSGISAAPSKVKAIVDCPAPTTPGEIRSLLGMTNFLSRFIPEYAAVIKPLRDLTRSNVPWTWDEEQEKAFSEVKKLLSQERNLSYFDTNKTTELLVDASPAGLGAILYQKEKDGSTAIIAYASKSLTDVETRYSQTEREALAIAWGIQHFHLYLYGTTFRVITDHMPLTYIFNKPNAKPPLRIERWLLKLQQYHFEVIYQPGRDNPADYMSRHPLPRSKELHHICTAEEYVNYISQQTAPKSLSLEEIKEETMKDPTLQTAIHLQRSGRWHDHKSAENCDKSIEVIAKVQGELTVNQDQDLLLRGNRIIIPATLQSRVIAIAHEGHQGISKTKALLREKVWFPGIDDKVNEALKGCLACQATTKTPTAVPLQPTVMPEHPWSELCADFWGPLPSGDYLMVVIDEHSRYPVVEHLRSTSAQAVIPVLDKIFAMFGTPEVLKTDNGPPWTSTQMKSFADYLGFHHRKVTPYWPCANGTAERFMRVLGKTVKAAVVEGKSWKQELHKMLRSYRATPHTTTNHPPATLLFQRAMKTRLPELTLKQPEVNKEAKQNDQKAKMEMKKYTDRKRRAKENNIDIGDTVLVSQRKQNKLTPPYDPKPHRVIGKKNTMITAENNGRRITRNATFFKKVKIEEEDSEDDCLEENNTEENKTEDHANRNHPQTTGNTSSYVTRFGRAVKPPKRLDL
ncbi:hypothetical protein Bbelb_079710 [Branchiostoma belcheri]|nr:hypothetical protein Bbelb_079710 [Branchiostoma belcheri]